MVECPSLRETIDELTPLAGARLAQVWRSPCSEIGRSAATHELPRESEAMGDSISAARELQEAKCGGDAIRYS